MLNKIKEVLIGPPLPTAFSGERKLNKFRALAAFSPDALSSIAYANQEIYLGLVVAGISGLKLSFPIGLAITGLLAIVALSYSQTIVGYPSGGGSYIVAKDNLGKIPGLIAASALLLDYILTAAVSLTAGVEALASAFPFLWEHRILASLFILLILTLLNLRGLKETGTIMAIPVYLFLFLYIPMLVYGVIRLIITGPVSLAINAPAPVQPLTLFLILHAFSTGCTALTGIEAISNGVPAFRPPEAINARKTLVIMAILMGILFAGSIGLTQSFAIVASPKETILSALARYILGENFGYFLIQTSTMLILAVAANTSFTGFPRLAAILAGDGFLPRQFKGLGDRLVFANGIVLLSGATALLIILFQGNSHALVPLFAVGAFTAFTFSQAGMVIHWYRLRGRSWLTKALFNFLGAVVTGTTTLIIGVSKFLEGAWITAIIVPAFMFLFLKINSHYKEVSRELSLRGLPPSLKPLPPARVVIPISGVHRGVIEAVRFAQSISTHVTAAYVELDPTATERVRERWNEWFPNVPLVILPSPYRSVIAPLLHFLDETDRQHNDGQLATVILPEFVPARWWQGVLHNQTAWLLRAAMLYRRRERGFQRAIIDIPYHLKR